MWLWMIQLEWHVFPGNKAKVDRQINGWHEKSSKCKRRVRYMIDYLETEKYLIIDSNIVLLDATDSVLYIPLVIENESEGKLKIRFVKDDNPAMAGIKIEPHAEENILELICINMNDANGKYSLHPIPLGEWKDRKFLVHISSSFHGGEAGIRRVLYTLYLEKDNK